MMNLDGEYLALTLIPELERQVFFEAEDVGVKRPVLILGKVEGETPRVGIWFNLNGAIGQDRNVAPPKPDRTILIRWEWIFMARLIPKPPTDATELAAFGREYGFRPR